MKHNLKLIPILFVSIGITSLTWANPQSSISSKILQQGKQMMTDNKYQKEEDRLTKLTQTSPSKSSYVGLANLYMAQNKNEQAIKNYQEASLYDPKDPKLFTSMSVAYLHQGLYEMSKAMAEHALTLDPALTHADKIITYIDKKQEVLKKAAEADKGAIAAHE